MEPGTKAEEELPAPATEQEAIARAVALSLASVRHEEGAVEVPGLVPTLLDCFREKHCGDKALRVAVSHNFDFYVRTALLLLLSCGGTDVSSNASKTITHTPLTRSLSPQPPSPALRVLQ